MSAALVVVNHGSSGLLAANLPVHVTAAADVDVVVVDNYSTAVERDRIAILAAERGWTLVEAANDGFGAGVNLGVAAAAESGSTEVILLNPDVVIAAETIAGLVSAVRAEPRSLVCPRLVDSSGRHHFDGFLLDLGTGATRRGWPGDDQQVGWLTAACLAISVAAFNQLGGLDQGYFMYWEDVELSWRARAAGLSLVVRDNLVAVHDEGGTQGRDGRAKSNLYYRYNARNRLRFAARNLSRSQLRAWLLATPAQTQQIWLRGGRRQLLSKPSSLLAAWRGAAEGLARGLRSLASSSSRRSTSRGSRVVDLS